MSDVAAQREVRRLKLLKNAENRMNRLKNKETAQESKAPQSEEDDTDSVRIDRKNDEQLTTETTSPYNLRHRTNKVPSEPPEQTTGITTEKKSSSPAPYEIVDDPEVPSLAEFLATQEAAKAGDGKRGDWKNKMNLAPPKTLMKNVFPEKRLEYIKILGIFLTALFSRWSLSTNFGAGVFFIETFSQSMFFPFLVFEVCLSYIVKTFLKVAISTAPSGSLLTTALMLCGIKAELVQLYIRIMCYVTSISNDFFLYIFAFLMWHAVLGS